MCPGGYGVTSGVNSVTGGVGLHYGVAGRIPTTSTIYHMGTLSKVPNTNWQKHYYQTDKSTTGMFLPVVLL